MKRLLLGLMVAAVAVIGFGVSASAGSGLQAFGTGTVTIGADGTSATILNQAGQYGGVYVQSKSQSGTLLNAVSFSFNSTGDVAGGAPRFSIPINTGGGAGSTTAYAFLDVRGCNSLATNGTAVTVSTTLPNCQVAFQGGGFYNYANWDAFARANPTYRIAQGHFPFIIADAPGSYAVDGIKLT
jgi:hypothetical protein